MTRLLTAASVALVVGLAALLASSPAVAGPVAPAIWYEFAFTGVGVPATGCAPADPGGPGCVPSSGTPTVFADAPAWTFVAPAGGAAFTITDAFLKGDEFTVFDFAAPIGTTPVVPDTGFCGDDPVPCLADPLVSHALLGLGPGPHAITITAADSPFGSGAAYFRWDPPGRVPEPATMWLVATGLAGIAGMAWRRHRRP